MSFKTIVTLLTLSCLSATDTALGLTERPPQEGGVQAVRESLTITAVRWLKNETSTTVQVCVETKLPSGTPSLSYRDGINVFTNEGVIDADLLCATFTKNANYTFTENEARYELTVVDTVEPGVLLARGVSIFAITVRSTLLICGDSLITKVTWSGSEILSEDFQCFEDSGNVDQACYHDGDITGTELCFGVKDAKDTVVNVCLDGPIDNRPHSIDPISSNYFYYGLEAVSKVAPDAILSLTMEAEGLNNMSAIVWEAEDPPSHEAARVAQVYACSTDDCTFPAYERKRVTYEVCLDVMDLNLATIETASTSFTDLKLNAFDGGLQKSMLVECVFANGLLGMKYTARLLGTLPEVDVEDDLLTLSNIDCTGVALNHACFGYLNTDKDAGIVLYVAVSAADPDYSNVIIVPFTIPNPV